MKSLEIVLHAASLSCCIALGAGVWTLNARLTDRTALSQPSIQSVQPAQPPAPELAAALREVSSLRREVAELREAHVAAVPERAPETSTRSAAPSAHPSGPAPTAVALQAALASDPGVRKQVQDLVEAQLKAEREEEEKARDERRQEDAKRWLDRRVDDLAKDLGLNDLQKGELARVTTDLGKRFDELKVKVRAKELTPDQAKAGIEMSYAEMEMRLQAVLSPDQYKQYVEKTRRFRETTLRNGFSEGGGRRGGRGNTP